MSKVGEHLTAKYLLEKECITYLEDKHIEFAIKELYQEGALTRSTDCLESKVTSLGSLAVRLPTDLKCTKLVLYGYIFGCLNECIVMAAALACKDLFWSPQRYAYRAEHFRKYQFKLKQALDSRKTYDKGLYSEPMACLMLYKEWLQAGKHNRPRKWCEERGIIPSRMNDFDREVRDMLTAKLALNILSTKSQQAHCLI